MTRVKTGIYMHFKGGVCYVAGVATDKETGKEWVVYRDREDGLFVCLADRFIEEIEREGYKGPRYQLKKVIK